MIISVRAGTDSSTYLTTKKSNRARERRNFTPPSSPAGKRWKVTPVGHTSSLTAVTARSKASFTVIYRRTAGGKKLWRRFPLFCLRASRKIESMRDGKEATIRRALHPNVMQGRHFPLAYGEAGTAEYVCTVANKRLSVLRVPPVSSFPRPTSPLSMELIHFNSRPRLFSEVTL